ncbi:MAG: hypothetical protein ABR524_10570 [Thermoanaerobaculia bacterium]
MRMITAVSRPGGVIGTLEGDLMIGLAARILLTTLALFAAQVFSAAVTMAAFGSDGLPSMAPGSLPFQVASNLIIVVVLAWLAQRARWRGWRLATALAVVLYGILSFNSIIEAMFFGFFTARTGAVILLMTALSSALFAPALLLLAKRDSSSPARSEWSLFLTAPRFAAGAAAYLVIYFVFGLIIFPFVADFYAGFGTPSMARVIGMALLVRGPIFVALAALIIAMSGASRRETILMVAVSMSVLGGVAPLMVPSSLFPDAVRLVHFIEVSSENLLFGWILGMLLTRPASPLKDGHTSGDESLRSVASVGFTPR